MTTDRANRPHPHGSVFFNLTDYEYTLLEMWMEGWSTTEMAQRRVMSVAGIRGTQARIRVKVRTHNKMMLARRFWTERAGYEKDEVFRHSRWAKNI